MMIHPFTIFVTLRFDPHVESTEEESNYFAPKMKDMLAAAASASVGPVACCPYLDPADQLLPEQPLGPSVEQLNTVT